MAKKTYNYILDAGTVRVLDDNAFKDYLTDAIEALKASESAPNVADYSDPLGKVIEGISTWDGTAFEVELLTLNEKIAAASAPSTSETPPTDGEVSGTNGSTEGGSTEGTTEGASTEAHTSGSHDESHSGESHGLHASPSSDSEVAPIGEPSSPKEDVTTGHHPGRGHTGGGGRRGYGSRN